MKKFVRQLASSDATTQARTSPSVFALAFTVLVVTAAACGEDDEGPDSFTFDAAVVATGGTGGVGALTGGGITAGGVTGGVIGGMTAGIGGAIGGLAGAAGGDSGLPSLDGGLACTGGLACGGTCVDPATDARNCGMCGRACLTGQRCEARQCVAATGGGTGGATMGGATTGGGSSSGVGANDGCSDTPAFGLSLAEVAVYQSIKIPIVKGTTAVQAGQRNADVVQGRDAVFRVHVTPGAGWTPRQISARLDLMSSDGSAPKRFYAQMSPSAASSDADPASAFRIKVPADAIAADTTYAVTLVECTQNAPPGAASGARFPADGFAPLGARKTGPLRVQIIPMNLGGSMPDVSPMAIETYSKRLMAIYPVTAVEMKVGEALASSGTSMCAHLTAISARRSADNAPIDVYYFGLTKGTSGGQSGCSNASPSASSRGKASVGWASSGGKIETGAATMCHEVGHAHGRQHAPCGVQDPDPGFPYPNANTGVWGYDARTETFLPPTRKDMMSYCPNPDRTQAWLSDYTYEAILERAAAVNALATQTFVYQARGAKVPWQTLVVDHIGIHWGEQPLLLHGSPDGVVVPAIIHDQSGPILTIDAYREELEDDSGEAAYLLTMPQPASDWYAIEVPGLLPTPLPFARR